VYSITKIITRVLFLFFLLTTSIKLEAQFFLPDTIIVCDDGAVDIEMEYSVSTSNILTNIDNTSFTQVSLPNDKFSLQINLGFNFEFYGISYDKVVLCSNAFLSFNQEYHHAFAPYTIDIALPNSSNTISANKVKNAVLAPWHDIDPSAGGTVDYAILGTAPDRVFVARWMDVPHVGCPELTSCSAIFLYENGNYVETHIAGKPTCDSWNMGQAIHGLQNDSGTVADLVNDPFNLLERNYPNTWVTGLEGVRFSPDGFGGYDYNFIDFIPFVPISDIIWSDVFGDSIGYGDSISWDPTESNNDVDIIYIESPLCSVDLLDSIVIISDPQAAIIGPPNPLCVTNEDSLTINISYADSVLWSTGETNESIGIPNDGDYSIQIFIDDCTYYDTINITSIDTNLLELGENQLFCQGDSSILDASVSGATAYLWSDGSTLATLTVYNTGTYTVDVTISGCLLTDSIQITAQSYSNFDFGEDQTICEGDTVLLDGYTDEATYLWSDSTTTSSKLVTGAGVYILSVDINGCTKTDTIEIFTIPRPFIDFGVDQTICQGDSVFLDAFNVGGGISYLWHDGSTNSEFTATETGLYHVLIDNGICSYSDSIQITVSPIPVIELGNDTAICETDSVVLDAFYSGATYLWQDGSTNATYSVTTTGEYSVLVTAGICTYTDTIYITVHPNPIIELGNDTTICDDQSVLLDATYPGITGYLWQDGSTDAQLSVTESGLYHVTLSNNNCYFSDSIQITVTPVPIIELGNDTAICETDILILDSDFPGATFLWQDGSTNSNYAVTETGEYSVLVTAGICTYTDTIYVTVFPNPVIELGNDTTICDDQFVLLDATYPGITSYLWQDGSTDAQLNVTESGLYHVTLSNNNCYFSDSIQITVTPVPIIELGNDTAICETDILILDSDYPGATFLWQDGTTNSNYAVTETGEYSVLITAGICTYRDTIQVTVYPNPDINLGNDTAICFGESILLDASYTGSTYVWQDSSVDSTYLVTETGWYIVQLENNNCYSQDSIYINIIDLPEIDLGPDTTICSTESLILSPGIYGAGYLWQDGSSDSTYSVTETGWYSVVVNAGSCSNMDSIYVTVYQTPTINLGSDTSICEGDSVLLDANHPDVTYTWQDGSTNPTFTANQTGWYHVTLNNNGCLASDSIYITVYPIPEVALGNDTTICDGEIIILDASFSEASYIWQDGSTNSNYFVTETGVYSVTITSNICTYTDSISIIVKPNPEINLGNDTAICLGESILLDATYPGATYLWQDGSTNAQYTASSTGWYTVQLENNNCYFTDSIYINNIDLPEIDLGADTTICSDESLVLSPGFLGAGYLWQDGSINTTYSVTETGWYHVLVTAGSCSNLDSIYVTVYQTPTVYLGSDTSICEGDAVLLDANHPNVTYTWQDGSTNPTFTANQTGWHHVTLDNNGCLASDSIFITVYAIPEIELGNDTSICDGDLILLDASYPNATYMWQDGSTNSNYMVTETGVYAVTVTSNICTYSDSISIIVKPNPEINLGNDTAICLGESILLDANYPGATYVWQDGSTNAQYTASTSGWYTVLLENNNCYFTDSIYVNSIDLPEIDLGADTAICSDESLILSPGFLGAGYLWQDGSTNSTYSVTETGWYNVLVSAGSCSNYDSIYVTVHQTPTVDLGSDTSICEGESALLDASHPGVTYTWQDGSTNATFTANQTGWHHVILDNNGCTAEDSMYITVYPIPEIELGNDTSICEGDIIILDAQFPDANYQWQDGSTNSTLTVTESGQYFVEVNVGVCYYNDTINIIVNPNPIINLGSDTAICAGDSILLNAGHENNTNYLWQDGSTDSTFLAQQSGWYVVTLENTNCYFSDSIFVDIIELPDIDLGPDTTICEGESVQLSSNISGASYLWQDGSTSSNFNANQTGWYHLTVSAGSCYNTDSIYITVNPTPVIDLGSDQVVCEDEVIILDATYPDATYTWQDGSTNPTLTVTSSGIYQVTVELNNCLFTDSVSITIHEFPEIDLGPDTLLCEGSSLILNSYSDGASYIWQDGSTNSNFIVSEEGTYFVEVNFNNCISTDTIEVSYSPIPVIDLGPDQSICEGDSVLLSAYFSNANYTWQDGSTDSNFVVTESGLYVVDLALNECYYTDSVYITVNHYPVFNLGNDTILCEGESIILNGYIDSASYEWQDGSTNSNFIVSQSGTYTLEVNLNGCITIDTLVVEYSPIPVIDLGENFDLCEGDTAILNAFFQGASYIWQDGSTDSIFTVTETGLYTVDLQINNCLYSDSIYINVYPYPVIELGPDTILCEGDSLLLSGYYAGASYAWNTSDTTSDITVTESGLYILEANNNNCISTDSILVTFYPIPVIELGGDQEICEGDSVSINAFFPDANYTWNTGDTTSSITVYQSGIYIVELNINNCIYTDSIAIIVHEYPTFNLGTDTSICNEESFLLDVSMIEGTYLWQNGDTSGTFTVTQGGTYHVAINNNGCISYDTIEVNILPLPIVSLGENIEICEGDSVLLDATSQFSGTTYDWNTGSTNPILVVDSTGTYSVTLTLDGCIYTTSVHVTVYPIPAINIADKVIICEGESYSIDASYPDNNTHYLWMDGSTNPVLNPAQEGLNIVTVELNGCYFIDSLVLEIYPLPVVELEDATICEGETHMFDASSLGGTHHYWNGGMDQPTYTATEEGWYVVQVENEYCYVTDSAYLTVIQKPQEGLPTDTTMCEGGSLEFNFDNSEYSYLWQDSIDSPDFTITQEGIYTLTVTNECGVSFFSMLVTPEDCSCEFYLPNAFSPGNDDVNETFKLFPDCPLNHLSFSVFNRWGKKVFYSDELENEWDGTYDGDLLPQDVYVYTLEYSFEDIRQVHNKQGTITLIR